MTPEQEEEFNRTAYAYRTCPIVNSEIMPVIKSYKNLCDLVDKFIQQAEDATWAAAREGDRFCDGPFEPRYVDISDWRATTLQKGSEK